MFREIVKSFGVDHAASRVPVPAGEGEVSLVLVDVQLRRLPDGAERREAFDLARLLLDPGHGGQQQGDEKGDDAEDDEDFDE